MRVLHITTWYPHQARPFEALWIRRFIESVTPHSEVYHLSVTACDRFNLKYWKEGQVKHRIWELPTKRWWFVEIVNLLLLASYLLKRRMRNDFDIINFHIAYPQLVFWSVLKYLVNKPVVVSEHWSAYHFNFGVTTKLPLIQQIFKHGLPVITVSNSLAEDIRAFCQTAHLKTYRVPNVVDLNEFQILAEHHPETNVFFMASQWKAPKRPHVIINAFARLIRRGLYDNYTLRIAGYGPQVTDLKELSVTLGLNEKVVFLGALSAKSMALEMNKCTAFLHCSEYETFSVVCAEALCCGSPVIASNVGGIREFVNASNGVLVSENTEDCWMHSIEHFIYHQFDRNAISVSAQNRFSPECVRRQYLKVINAICEAEK